jgi:polyhydroxyalkanoate synthase
MKTHQPEDRYIDPDSWMASVEVQPGSWWPAWNDWLDRQMSRTVNPPRMGAPAKGCAPIDDAPGRYVHE